MENSPSCPKCNSHNVIPIKYGLPRDKQAFEPVRQGEVEWGGCCIDNNSPIWRCKSCGHPFGKIIFFEESSFLESILNIFKFWKFFKN